MVSEEQPMTHTCLSLPTTSITLCAVLSLPLLLIFQHCFLLIFLLSCLFFSFLRAICSLLERAPDQAQFPWELVQEAQCPLTCQTTAVAMWFPLLYSCRRPAGIYSIFSKQGIIPEVHSGESTLGNSHWEVRVKDFIIKKTQTNNKNHKITNPGGNAISFQVIL